MRFEVLTASGVRTAVLWNVTLVKLRYPDAGNSRSLRCTYQTERRHIPEDATIHGNR